MLASAAEDLRAERSESECSAPGGVQGPPPFSLDKQHFAVGRQRPQLVRHHDLDLIADFT